MKKSQPLPRKLFLQLDNTARENKNRCVMSFLSLLVHKGIFEDVSAVLYNNLYSPTHFTFR